MIHTKRHLTMKQAIEPILGGITACCLVLYFMDVQESMLMLTISILLLMVYYMISTIVGAVKGSLNPVFNHEVSQYAPAKLSYIISGIAIAFACFAIFMRFVEGSSSIMILLLSLALLIFAIFRIDYLFHETSDRRHLKMMYRLGIYAAVIIIAYVVNVP